MKSDRMSAVARAMLIVVCAGALWPAWTIAGATSVEQTGLTVEDPRPVAAAVMELTRRYGYLITYEDPRYAYDADTQDITLDLHPELANVPAATVRKTLVPAGGTLDMSYAVSAQSHLPDDPVALIRQLLDTEANTGRGGRFRVIRSGEYYHVVPQQVRDSDGMWVAQSSILDARISIPDAVRTTDEMLVAICAALSEQTMVHVGIGTAPFFSANERGSMRGAHNAVARDVLQETLEATGAKVLWRLLYAPDDKAYALNLRVIPQKPAQNSPTPISQEARPFNRPEESKK